MRVKEGVVLAGLDIRIRPALIAAEKIWCHYGRPEGVTVTSGLDGQHSASSLHYYGLALDFRTHYFSSEERLSVFDDLSACLSFDRCFQVVYHSTHIHVEYDVGRKDA